MLSGSLSIWHWLIVLVIVIAVFGTKKLRGAGGDLGAAVRNFKAAVREGEADASRQFALEALPASPSQAAQATVPAAERSVHSI